MNGETHVSPSAMHPRVGRKLLPATPISKALLLLSRRCLVRLARQHRLALAGDVEAVHEMRVALRQLRVLFRTFESAIGTRRVRALRVESKWISNELGLVRDLDVFVEALDHDHGSEVGAQVERRRLGRVRRQLHLRLATALRSPRYSRLLANIRDAVEEAAQSPSHPPVSTATFARIDTFAAPKLARRWRRFVRAAYRVASLDSDQRHQLRIRGRKLRYAMEFFGDAFPGRTRRKRLHRAVDVLRKIQDSLGALNDTVQQRALRARYTARGTDSIFDDADDAAPVGGHRAERLLRSSLAAIHEFETIKPFWA